VTARTIFESAVFIQQRKCLRSVISRIRPQHLYMRNTEKRAEVGEWVVRDRAYYLFSVQAFAATDSLFRTCSCDLRALYSFSNESVCVR
jgi:hypothetical protein